MFVDFVFVISYRYDDANISKKYPAAQEAAGKVFYADKLEFNSKSLIVVNHLHHRAKGSELAFIALSVLLL